MSPKDGKQQGVPLFLTMIDQNLCFLPKNGIFLACLLTLSTV